MTNPGFVARELRPFAFQVRRIVDGVIESSVSVSLGPDVVINVALHTLGRMAVRAGESTIGENDIDAFGLVDFGKDSVASVRQVVGIVDIEDSVIQITLNQAIYSVKGLDIVVVCLAKRRNDKSALEITTAST